MTQIKGQNVSETLRPNDTNDKFPVTLSNENKGGAKQFTTLADYYAVPLERRTKGEFVYIEENDSTYQLKDGLENSNLEFQYQGNLRDIFAEKADLVGGKIPSSQIPAVAIVEFLGNAQDESEMLQFIGQKGDWCTRSDLQSAYFITGEDPSQISNWQKILTPTSPVTSVNGHAGPVVLSKADIGLGSVPDVDYGPLKMDKPIGNPLQYIAADGTYKDFPSVLPINITSPSSFDSLIYNANTGRWENTQLNNIQEIGIFDATTGIATVQNVTILLSAIPPSTWLNGQSVDVTKKGNLSFSGINFSSGVAVNVRDKLRKRGNQFELLPASISLNTTLKTNNLNFLANGLSNPFVSTSAVFPSGTVLAIKLVGADGVKYAFQVRNTAGNYPVVATNLLSNILYEIELTQDINLLGVTELTSNTQQGTVYLNVEVYSYLYEAIYRNKSSINTLAINQQTIQNDVNFYNFNIACNKDPTSLITNTRKGFKILSSYSIEYIDKAIKEISFFTYHKNIKRIFTTLNTIVVGNYIEFKYEIITDRDVSYRGSYYVTSLSSQNSTYWVKVENYGLCRIELDYSYLMSNTVKKFRVELDINTSIDTDDVLFDNILDFGQKEWIPTISCGITGNLNYNSVSFVQNNSNFNENKNTLSYSGIYWNMLQPDSPNQIDQVAVHTSIADAIEGGYKKGLLILPSTMPSAAGGNSAEINGETVYYRFPVWLYNSVMTQTDGLVGVYKPTIETATDYQTGARIKVMFLDYRDLLTQSYFKNAIDLLFTFFHNINDGVFYYKYIDFIKVGMFGRWGEGSVWNNIPDWNTLITISDYVVNKFSDKICLQPMSPILGSSYPLFYPSPFMDYLANGISANNVRFGLFVDNIGKFQDRFRENPIFVEEYYQKIYRIHEKAPIYAECWQYLPEITYFQIEPPFRRLITEIMLYRPHWLSVSNLFYQTNIEKNPNIFKMLKKVSEVVGAKIYLQNNRTTYNTTTNVLNVWFTLGNMGTSKIYHSYWKLRVTITDNSNSETFLLLFDLRTLKAAFNPGVINWRETSAIIQELQLTKTYNTNIITAYLQIIDEDNILPNMYIGKENTYNLM